MLRKVSVERTKFWSRALYKRFTFKSICWSTVPEINLFVRFKWYKAQNIWYCASLSFILSHWTVANALTNHRHAFIKYLLLTSVGCSQKNEFYILALGGVFDWLVHLATRSRHWFLTKLNYFVSLSYYFTNRY